MEVLYTFNNAFFLKVVKNHPFLVICCKFATKNTSFYRVFQYKIRIYDKIINLIF